MKVILQSDGKRTVEAEKVSVLQTNRAGGFMLLSPYPRSRYEGAFFKHKNDLFKAIESIELPGEVVHVHDRLFKVTREREGVSETFCMPDGKDAIIYQLSKTSEVLLNLDGRAIFDNRAWGRNYTISVEHKCLVVSFAKTNDPRDGAGDTSEYPIHLAVFGEGLEYLPVNKWVEHFYEQDQARNSYPWSRWVYQACKLRVKEAVFAFGMDKAKTVETAINVYAQRKQLMAAKEKRITKLVSPQLKNPDMDAAHAAAVAAVDALAVGDEGYYAGIPWFCQFWTRDELVATGALMRTGQYDAAKRVLWKYLDSAGEAALPRFVGDVFAHAANPGIPAADGLGLLFFRIGEFITILEKARKLKTHLPSRDLDLVERRLASSLDALFKQRSKDGLIVNSPEETWMDTTFGDDKRDGARIEIQALTLAMLKLLGELRGKPDNREKALREVTRRHFFTGKTLKDGKEDPVLRPNLFLAGFFYPALLSKKEWSACCDTALKALLLDWGGLATIDVKHPLFTPQSTGENAKSYHRGDSWFWVNHLAAIVLHRTDKKRYGDVVRRILKASLHEQQALGAVGHMAELSSAAKLAAEGAVSQLWSSATLVELLHEL